MARLWAAVASMMALAGCATGPTRYPVDAVRYHYDPVAQRGPVFVEGFSGDAGPETQAFAAAVRDQLVRAGFTPATDSRGAQFIASVQVSRREQPLPPRASPFSIGIGGASFGGGRGGGVGVGGGVGFPVGGHGSRLGTVTELSVRLRQGPNAVWEGQARTVAEAASAAADTGTVAGRLAGAMFQGFPGESGRSIEVR